MFAPVLGLLLDCLLGAAVQGSFPHMSWWGLESEGVSEIWVISLAKNHCRNIDLQYKALHQHISAINGTW